MSFSFARDIDFCLERIRVVDAFGGEIPERPHRRFAELRIAIKPVGPSGAMVY
jgi:hypothetical protein